MGFNSGFKGLISVCSKVHETGTWWRGDPVHLH